MPDKTRPETTASPIIGRQRQLDTAGAEAFVVTPFSRLVRTHMLSAAGDALMAVALADSLFFNVDPNDARWKVAAYLLLTLAPFAVVAPFLGPMMDRVRGGHRWMLVGAAIIRAAIMFALVRYVQGPFLFPLAFSMLVMAKTHAIAKTSLVPAMVDSHNALVSSNARLALLGGVASGMAGVPGVAMLRLSGAPMVLTAGSLVFVVAAVSATRLPRLRVASESPGTQAKPKLATSEIATASRVMGYVRGVVGFVTLLLAFELRGGIDPGPDAPGVELGHRVRESLGLDRLDLTTGGAPAWHFGVALVGVGLGGFAGSLGVPRLKAYLAERQILGLALFALALMCGLAALAGGVVGAFLAGFGIAIAGNGAKQAFDAIVQRDSPKADLGRSFGRFESTFQLMWVVGALIPSVLPVPARLGYMLVAGSAGAGAIFYWFGHWPTAGFAAQSVRRLSQSRPDKSSGI